MKGIVFTEFIKMVEEKFGVEVSDEIIESSNLKSEGVYTSIGTYSHMELLTMVGKLGKIEGVPINDLLMAYGEYLFVFFTNKYENLFEGISNPMHFLSKIDSYIHVEVKKLYPDAELPAFEIIHVSDAAIEMIYSSQRKLSAFAQGLLLGCAKYFKVEFEIDKEDLSDGQGTRVRFDVSIK